MTTKLAQRVASNWLRHQMRASLSKEAKGLKIPRIDSDLTRVFNKHLGVTDAKTAQFIWSLFLRASEIATSYARDGAQEEPSEQLYSLDGTETSTESGRDGAEYVEDAETADVSFTSSITITLSPVRTTGREIKKEFFRLARTFLKRAGLDAEAVWSLWTKYVADEVTYVLNNEYEEHEVRDTDRLENLMEEHGSGEFDAEGENSAGGDSWPVSASGDSIGSWYVDSGTVNLEYTNTSTGDIVQTGSASVSGTPRFSPYWD